MENVNIIENNGIQTSVNLINYFSDNNKNYIFYTKNETVQGGLFKIYVASQNNGMTEAIGDDEWTNLKKIMQAIIMGNATITYLNYEGTLQFNESKAIALKEDNIKTMQTAYTNAIASSEQSGGTNKDLLTESFSTEVKNDIPVEQGQDVQISSIPSVQNNFNMESTPVNLSTEAPIEPVSIAPVEEVAPVQNVDSTQEIAPFQNTQSIEPIVPDVPVTPETPVVPETPLNINNITPPDFDSGFKVSNEPNIFDQPINSIGITQDEINQPNDVVEPVVPTAEPVSVEPVSNNLTNSESSVDNDAQIALNERKIKLFEELASIYKEENELLKGNNTENTASDLFNNNGSLNESKVMDN